ncbi:hypothetical protein [Pseudomonas zeae]|uniref:Uncharacterized protein n=1 Tax=Pseudomonas zeae TaxID=2745510 RepID=A0A9E6NP14_9PSED|nr:hypothetical protein [Pseudomonas zeae]QXI11261.1 hypothetical protein HU754_026320 [Pseudomonas zeae]
MKLKRHKKTLDGHDLLRLEACDSNLFVAFWIDSNKLFARDRDGVKWMLERGTSLRSIEKGADGISRIHTLRLIRGADVESCQYVAAKEGKSGYGVVRVAGYDYRVSLRYWNVLCRES